MVTHPRTPNRPRRPVVTAVAAQPAAPKLRALNQPRPITIETNEHGVPATIVISKIRRAVESVLETWRIDDEWWRAHPISRTYYRLFLEDGRTVDVYRNLARNRWYRQSYAG